MASDSGWGGVPIELCAPLQALEDAAKAAGYEARTGVKTNERGELVLAVILACKPYADQREAKRLERLKRS